MNKRFQEELVVIDNISWLQKFASQTLQSLGQSFVILPSTSSMQAVLPRFRKAERIWIHWESTHRHGGAIVEELREIDPFFPIDEKIIILTTNPRQEDVYYFSELDVQKIVRVAQHRPGFQRAFTEIKTHYTSAAKSQALDSAWKRIQKHVDSFKVIPTERQIIPIESAINELKLQGVNKPSARYFDLLATICDWRNKPENAEMFWLKALELNPNYFRASEKLVDFYERNQQFDSAIRLIQRLNVRNKNSVSRMIQLGRVHRKIKQDDKAEHYFQLALDKDKFSSRALNGLAEIRFDQGKFDEAKTLLKRSNRSIDTASYLNQRGIELVKLQKYEEALNLYKNAQYVLPLQEKGPMLFYNMALCYSRWGKQDKAIDFLRLALIKKPDYSKASELLTKLLGASTTQAAG